MMSEEDEETFFNASDVPFSRNRPSSTNLESFSLRNEEHEALLKEDSGIKIFRTHRIHL